MKKIVALLLSLVMVFALGACAGKTEAPAPAADAAPAAPAADAAPAAPAAGGAVKAVYCSAMNNESQAFALKMFQKHQGEYGMTVEVLDDQGDAAKQADNVKQAAANGYNWIIVNPADASGIVTTLKSVHEQYPDIMISTYSSDVPAEGQEYRNFFVGINDIDAGHAAANAFIKLFPDGAKMVEIGGQAGHNAQILRHDGFMDIMKDHPEFEILDCQNCEHWAADEAQSIAEDMVTKYGDDIQAVYCHWDNGVTGVYNAFKTAGLEVPILGVDGCRAGFDQVNEGVQFATIMNNFEAQAILSFQLAQKVQAGEAVDSENYSDLDIVTKDNINDFEVPEW